MKSLCTRKEEFEADAIATVLWPVLVDLVGELGKRRVRQVPLQRYLLLRHKFNQWFGKRRVRQVPLQRRSHRSRLRDRRPRNEGDEADAIATPWHTSEVA